MHILQINYGKYEERGSKSPSQLELPAHWREHVFPLLLATHYYFSVAAMNAHGRGPFSAQNFITTNSTSKLFTDVEFTSLFILDFSSQYFDNNSYQCDHRSCAVVMATSG